MKILETFSSFIKDLDDDLLTKDERPKFLSIIEEYLGSRIEEAKASEIREFVQASISKSILKYYLDRNYDEIKWITDAEVVCSNYINSRLHSKFQGMAKFQKANSDYFAFMRNEELESFLKNLKPRVESHDPFEYFCHDYMNYSVLKRLSGVKHFLLPAILDYGLFVDDKSLVDETVLHDILIKDLPNRLARLSGSFTSIHSFFTNSENILWIGQIRFSTIW